MVEAWLVPVGVDEEGEGAEGAGVVAVVVEGGEEEHQHWGHQFGTLVHWAPPIWPAQSTIWRTAAGRVGTLGNLGVGEHGGTSHLGRSSSPISSSSSGNTWMLILTAT